MLVFVVVKIIFGIFYNFGREVRFFRRKDYDVAWFEEILDSYGLGFGIFRV